MLIEWLMNVQRQAGLADRPFCDRYLPGYPDSLWFRNRKGERGYGGALVCAAVKGQPDQAESIKDMYWTDTMARCMKAKVA